jgi:hypothetical protein
MLREVLLAHRDVMVSGKTSLLLVLTANSPNTPRMPPQCMRGCGLEIKFSQSRGVLTGMACILLSR